MVVMLLAGQERWCPRLGLLSEYLISALCNQSIVEERTVAMKGGLGRGWSGRWSRLPREE